MKKAAVKQNLSIYYLLPLLFTISIVPLIVLLRVVPLDEIAFQYWTGVKTNSDFFSYYKAVLLMTFTALSIIVYIIGQYNKRLELKQVRQYYAPMAVYALFIILSALLSKYPNTARMGFVDRYEGVFVLLSYLAVTFLMINLIQNENHLRTGIILLFISASIIGTIGILQYFGMDLFKTQFGKELILTPQYQSAASTMDFTFGKYTIYSTLYNTNFVGSYMAMLFPVSLIFYILAKQRNTKILSGLFTCLMFANLIGCRSRAGYLGGLAAVLVLLVIYRKALLQNLKKISVILLCYIVILAGMNAAAGGALIGRFFATEDQAKEIAAAASKKVNLKDLVISGKTASIITASETLNLDLNGNQLAFTDTDGKQLGIINNANGTITFSDKRYSLYSLNQYSDGTGIRVSIGSMQFDLYVYEGGFKIYGERGTLLDSVDHPEKFGFEGQEKMASARGYIWSRSIPLLKKTLLTGYGPDAYVYAFPQHDYVGKLLAFDRTAEIVDKPHNLYLQIGVNTGVVSLIAFLALLVIYLWSCIKLYFTRAYQTLAEIMGGAVFTAVCGYLVSGVFNDSLVSVAPVFWGLLGIGICCNYMILNKIPAKNENSKQQSTNKKNSASSSRGK